MAKIHMVQSPSPLTDGWRALTMCGIDIASVAIGAMVDSGEFDDVDAMIKSRGVCEKCKQEVWSMRYLFFVRETADPSRYDS